MNIYINNYFKYKWFKWSNQKTQAEWIKNNTHIYTVYKKPTSDLKNTYRLKVRGWKNIFHANGKQKKSGVSILISDMQTFK